MRFKEWLEDEFVKHETSDGIELSYRGAEPSGSIYAKRDVRNPNLYRVTRVWVKPEGRGYGKRLYLAILDLVSKRGGLLCSAGNSTSDSAAKIWISLYLSNNVEKVPLNYRDWPESGRNRFLLGRYPDLRYSDLGSYPPSSDVEFWAFNSGYRVK